MLLVHFHALTSEKIMVMDRHLRPYRDARANREVSVKLNDAVVGYSMAHGMSRFIVGL